MCRSSGTISREDAIYKINLVIAYADREGVLLTELTVSPIMFKILAPECEDESFNHPHDSKGTVIVTRIVKGN